MLIVTTSRSVLAVNETTGRYRRLETGNGLYYGIARKDDRFYIAARRRMVSSSVPRESEEGEIRVFDDRFGLVDIWRSPFALRDLHQICFVGDDLFVTCSFDNLVAIRRPNGSWDRWYPLGRPESEPFDKNHLNSIYFTDNQIVLVAHNHERPSEIFRFDPTDLQLIGKFELGRQAHDFWVENGVFHTCSSGEGSIRSGAGMEVVLGGFPRGFAKGGERYYVGVSEIAERSERDLSTGSIAVLDQDWNLERRIVLCNEGLVLDVLFQDDVALIANSPDRARPCWCGNADFAYFGPDYGVCQRCGTLVYLEDMPVEKFLVRNDDTDFYGKKYWLEHQRDDFGYADIYARARNDLTERNLHWLKTLLKYRLPPADVLELGCSHGSFVALLRQTGYEASGVEMSPWVVEFGRNTFGVPISVGPIESLDIPQGSFDVIVLMDVLEHLPDPVATMAHCLQLLRPDGLLLIQTPQFRENMRYEALLESNARFIEMLVPEEHLYLFSDRSITRLFKQQGAEHVRFEQAIFAHYDMSLVVSRTPLQTISWDETESTLLATPGGRSSLALLDLRERELSLIRKLQESEADRAARGEQIETLTKLILDIQSGPAAGQK